MADQQQRARVGLQHALQQVDGFQVQVVGGLVQHQQVGRAGKQARQQQAVALTARQGAHRRVGAVGREQEVLQIAHDVAARAIDLDVFRAWADRVGHALLGVKLLTQLIEIGNLQVGAQPHRAGVGRVFAQDELEQRGLADAVGADQADAVTAHDGEIQVAHQAAPAQADAGLAGLADQLAGAFARIHLQADLAGALAPGGPRLAQRLQPPHATFVACAARLDALADPDLFLRPELVELAVGHRLGLQLLATHLLIGGEVAGEAAHQPAIQFDDAGGHLVEEAPVVRDDDGRRPRVDDGLQRLDGLDVEMVGGLVQQQQVGFQRKGQRQRRPLVLPARKPFGINLRIDAEAVQLGPQPRLQRPVAPLIPLVHQPGRRAARQQALEERAGRRQHRLLLHQHDAQAVAHHCTSVIELDAAGNDVEQAGLSGAVTANQPKPLAGGKGEGRPIQQGVGTKGQAGIDQAEEDTHGRDLVAGGGASGPCRWLPGPACRWAGPKNGEPHTAGETTANRVSADRHFRDSRSLGDRKHPAPRSACHRPLNIVF